MTKGKVSLFSTLLAHWAFVIGIKSENVGGIKLETVEVPQYAIKDGQQTLRCTFRLQSETLLVLKWYKDGHEFFRFSPQSSPQTMIFPVQGVHVDTINSNMNQVILKDISLASSGKYKCEVSAEKSFRTLFKQGDMIVIAPPQSVPEISGVHSAISLGETLHANCTSFYTKPAAALMFYINGEKAEIGDMIEYLPISETDGLETSVLGLTFQIDSRHFRDGSGLELKCTATIGNGYWVAKKKISEASINAQPSIPGKRELSGAGSTKKQLNSFVVHLLLLLILLQCFHKVICNLSLI